MFTRILRMLLRGNLWESEGIAALGLEDRRWRNTERVDRRRNNIGLPDVKDGGIIMWTKRRRIIGIVQGSRG